MPLRGVRPNVFHFDAAIAVFVDFIRGFLTGGAHVFVRSLECVRDVRFSVQVGSDSHCFDLGDAFCLCNVGAQMCQAYMHMEYSNGIFAPKNI